MKTKEILLKHLTAHFGEGAEVYIKDHPCLITHLEAAINEAANNYDSLLEALKECVNQFESVGSGSGDEGDLDTIIKANKAIKKATI